VLTQFIQRRGNSLRHHRITAGSILLSSGCAIAIGLFFGLYPAFRAAGLSPLNALRYD
jgi:putative ABC transport system permease protein